MVSLPNNNDKILNQDNYKGEQEKIDYYTNFVVNIGISSSNEYLLLHKLLAQNKCDDVKDSIENYLKRELYASFEIRNILNNGNNLSDTTEQKIMDKLNWQIHVLDSYLDSLDSKK